MNGGVQRKPTIRLRLSQKYKCHRRYNTTPRRLYRNKVCPKVTDQLEGSCDSVHATGRNKEPSGQADELYLVHSSRLQLQKVSLTVHTCLPADSLRPPSLSEADTQLPLLSSSLFALQAPRENRYTRHFYPRQGVAQSEGIQFRT